jgi:hypothetical protein
MLQNRILQAAMWVSSVAVLTAFSEPLAVGGAELGRVVGYVSEEGCSKCEDNDQNQHKFDGLGAFKKVDGAGCATSHTNWASGWCDQQHCECGETEETTSSDRAYVRLSVDAVERAARSADVYTTAALMRRYPGRLVYNSARGVLQVTGCDGRITAQFPVQSLLHSALGE